MRRSANSYDPDEIMEEMEVAIYIVRLNLPCYSFAFLVFQKIMSFFVRWSEHPLLKVPT